MAEQQKNPPVQVSQALGMGAEYRPEGSEKVYRLSPWTFEIQGAFEEHLKRVTLEAANILDRINPASADVARSKIVQEIGMGLYAFGGDYVRKALDTKPHMLHMLYLMVKKNHNEVSKEMVAGWFEKDPGGLTLAALLANGVEPAKAGEGEADGEGLDPNA